MYNKKDKNLFKGKKMIKKINKKYEKFLFSLFVSMFMAVIMSLVITWLNLGFIDNFISIWLTAGAKAFCVGFPAFLISVPIVRKFVSVLVEEERK